MKNLKVEYNIKNNAKVFPGLFLFLNNNMKNINRFFVASYNCDGCLNPSAFGNLTAHGILVTLPYNSALMKFAILPKHNANAAGIAIKSASFRKLYLYFLVNK